MTHQKEKKLLRQYIVSNYEPGHELMRLMNSGSEWVAKVKKIFG